MNQYAFMFQSAKKRPRCYLGDKRHTSILWPHLLTHVVCWLTTSLFHCQFFYCINGQIAHLKISVICDRSAHRQPWADSPFHKHAVLGWGFEGHQSIPRLRASLGLFAILRKLCSGGEGAMRPVQMWPLTHPFYHRC